MTPPVFNDDLCLLQCVEDLAVEQLIAQLAVEALAVAILPRASEFDVGGPGANSSDPIPKCFGDKLRSVVGADVDRNAARYKLT